MSEELRVLAGNLAHELRRYGRPEPYMEPGVYYAAMLVYTVADALETMSQENEDD